MALVSLRGGTVPLPLAEGNPVMPMRLRPAIAAGPFGDYNRWMGRVLVTGGSGFIAGHCILQLLAAGYEVRATVREAPEVGATLVVLPPLADLSASVLSARRAPRRQHDSRFQSAAFFGPQEPPGRVFAPKEETAPLEEPVGSGSVMRAMV